MGSSIDFGRITIRPTLGNGELSKFRCGVPEIDKWACDQADRRHVAGRFRVFVATEADGATPLGFFALSFTTEQTSKLLHQDDRDQWKQAAPLFYIQYLAVSRSLQRQKLGEFMLSDILLRAYYVAQHVSFCGVALRSLNERTEKLYRERFRFVVAPGEDVARNPLMILPMRSIIDLVEGPRT